jgi:aryl-alcohol dehydrogenase-like predicted oxidoreductase
MGKCSKKDAFAIMDAFYENGGNFIDTYVMLSTIKKQLTLPSANNYQSEQSEEWIGDWMRARRNRDQMV